MENASKALIIAGAILLSILIIALGVFVFNQAKSSIGNTGLADQEIAAFNSKFESYGGTQQGSTVKSLITVVKNYNNTTDEDFVKIISGTTAPNTDGKFETSKPTTYPTAQAGEKYNVTFQYANSGKICAIYFN